MNNSFKRGLVTAALLVGTAGIAFAGPTPLIIFQQSGVTSGTLSYDGSGDPLNGTNISFGNVLGQNTNANSGNTLACDPCTLNFSTGNNTQEGPSQWDFAAGGNFTISGSLYSSSGLEASGALLTGTFTAPSSVNATGTGNSMQLAFSGVGTDQKAPGLLEYFGFSSGMFTFGSTVISSENISQGPEPGQFSGDVTTVSVTNKMAVPEPGVLGMFGFGLLMLGAVMRWRGKAR